MIMQKASGNNSMAIAGLALSLISVIALISAGMYSCGIRHAKKSKYIFPGIDDAAKARK
jgi:hypothetical protein